MFLGYFVIEDDFFFHIFRIFVSFCLEIIEDQDFQNVFFLRFLLSRKAICMFDFIFVLLVSFSTFFFYYSLSHFNFPSRVQMFLKFETQKIYFWPRKRKLKRIFLGVALKKVKPVYFRHFFLRLKGPLGQRDPGLVLPTPSAPVSI